MNSNGGWFFYDVRGGVTTGRTFKGLCGWREHQASGQVAAEPSTPFQELWLSRQRDARAHEEEGAGMSLLADSVLVLPGLVTAAECAHLSAAADRTCVNDEWSGVALRRIECHPDGINLDGRSHALASIIIARALWSVEKLRPELAAELFDADADLGDMWFKFSGQEPMLNRYTAGGLFEPHQDGHALTILVPLDNPGEGFSGGGTAFWSEATIGTDSKQASQHPPSLVMRPPAGTALFWRGHITHAGLPVQTGVRHVFVASFDLRPAGMKHAIYR